MNASQAAAIVGLSVVAAVIPTVLYVLLVWWIDRYEKEPLRLLLAAFVWGAVPAVVLSAILEVALQGPAEAVAPRYAALLGSAIAAPVIEETVKGLALLALYALVRQEYDDVLDGVVYGSIVGLGFGMAENALYFSSGLVEGSLWHWTWLVFGRAIAFGLNHAMYTSFTGAALGAARNMPSRRDRWLVVLAGLAAAVAAHAVHNLMAASDLCLLGLLLDWGGLLVILVIVALAWQRERRWMETYLADEVRSGLLSRQEHALLTSRGGRYRQFLRTLAARGYGPAALWRALASTAAELAFRRHQLSTMGEEGHSSASIAALRARLSAIRQRLDESLREEQA